MQTKSKRLLTIAAILVVGLAAYWIATAPQPPDTEQIIAQLETGRAAASRRDTSGIMSIVSADYRDDVTSNVTQLHVRLVNAFRHSGPLDISMAAPTITIEGNQARSVSRITIQGQGQGQGPHFSGTITLRWKKEPARRYWVFPTTAWRVVGAEYPGYLLSDDE